MTATSEGSIAGALRVRRQRRRWSRSVHGWDHHGSAGLGTVVEAVLEATQQEETLGLVIDLGAGTGALAIPLAQRARQVVAVDVSGPMLDRLAERTAAAGVDNVDLRVCAIERFELPPGSADLVVSNYALHHLANRDKALLVERAFEWLRPGGALVIGDMMIGWGVSAEDRSIMAGKVRIMLGRGPAGWWRIVKNVWRLLLRTSEKPVPLRTWEELLIRSGFVEVTARRVVSEAGLVTGHRPSTPASERDGEGFDLTFLG